MNDDTQKRNKDQDLSFQRMSALFERHANFTDATPRPGFKEALFARLTIARSAPDPMSHFSLGDFFAHYKKALAPASAAAFAVLIIAVLVFQPFVGVRPAYAQDQFTLTPESADAAGVAADSVFLLESREPVDAADIEKSLTVRTTQNVDYRLEQISPKNIRLAFANPLTPEEIITVALDAEAKTPDGAIILRDYRWAFQVKGDFRVTGAIPADRMTDVPTDIGIEFTFNYENISEKEFEHALTIEPAVNGHIEHHRRTFVFVPDNLAQGTLYKITLSGSLPLEGSSETLGEDYHAEFVTFKETPGEASFGVDEKYLTTTPQMNVAIGYSWSAEARPAVPVHVRLYDVGSFDAYLTSLKIALETSWPPRAISVADLAPSASEPALAFDAERVDEDGEHYLIFPVQIPAGYFAADIEYDGKHDWTLIASSNLTAFTSRAVNKTLLWVNDAATNAPAAGVNTRYLEDELTRPTDANGVAELPSTEDQSTIIEVRRGDEGIALLLDGRSAFESEKPWAGTSRMASGGVNDWWTYVYTDRPTYRPTDTVRFWGYADRRDGGGAATRVCATLDELEKTCVDVSERGTFEGTIDLKRVPANYYSLTIFNVGSAENWPLAEPEELVTRGISVSEYVKPAYTLSLTADVEAAFVGDSVGFTVHGEYFEGTPVNGLSVYVSGDCVNQTVVLDEKGNGRGSFSCEYQLDSNYPQSMWLSARPERPEEGEMETSASVRVFGPKIFLDINQQNSFIKNRVGSVELAVRNTEAINSWDPLIFAPTVRAGASVQGSVTEITYTKKEIGTRYDFIRKQTVKTYQYDRKEKILREFSVASGSDGVARYEFPAANPDANYIVKLTATDELGRTDRRETWLWQRQEQEYESDWLEFHNDDVGAEDPWAFPGYGVGEDVHLSIYKGSKLFIPESGGRFLYYQAQRGLRDVLVSSDPRYVFSYDAGDVPNLSVYAMYYVGGRYQYIGSSGWWSDTSGFAIAYDEQRSNLTITVTPDKQGYEPGEEATLSVHVTDKAGDSISAEVNLNVVDEAYYAIFPEDVNPLGSLYGWVDTGIVATQASSVIKSPRMGAEKGGGGDRGRGRMTFKDTASFASITTDQQGNGATTIRLPDNVTSWRVTAQAIEHARKMAGDAKINLDASLPFFIDLVMQGSYLPGDKPIAIARAAGTAVGLDESVEWTVRIPDGSFELKKTQPAGDALRIAFPELALGPHEVTISADVGSHTDTMTRIVTILPSRLVKPVIATTPLDESGTIPGADDRYTEITFLDGGSGKQYGELSALSASWGNRADEAIVRSVATALLNAEFGEKNEVPELPSGYVSDGVAITPYATSDFDLTARVSLLGEDIPWDFAGYFDAAIEAGQLTPRETAQAFAAMGAMGEPVLAELQRAASAFTDDVDAQLWTALGLHAMGDGEGARKIYRELVKETTARSGYVYLKADDIETTAERTALLAILAAGLQEPDAEKLQSYATEQNAGQTLVLIERLLIVKNALAHSSGEVAEVSYTIDGEQHSVELSRGEALTLLVSPDDLQALAPTATRGSAVAVSKYLTHAIDPNAPRDRSIEIARSYASEAGESVAFDANDLIKVSLDYSVPASNCQPQYISFEESVVEIQESFSPKRPVVPCETYEITDIIPSGLKVVTPTYAERFSSLGECQLSPTTVEEGRITFFITPEFRLSACHQNVVYYARVVTPGTYVAEPAYIRSVRDPEANNRSDDALLTIQP